MYQYKEQWYEKDCQYGGGDYFVYYFGVDCMLVVGIGVGVGCYWQYVEDECQ